jgi:hypothetical protein
VVLLGVVAGFGGTTSRLVRVWSWWYYWALGLDLVVLLGVVWIWWYYWALWLDLVVLLGLVAGFGGTTSRLLRVWIWWYYWALWLDWLELLGVVADRSPPGPQTRLLARHPPADSSCGGDSRQR